MKFFGGMDSSKQLPKRSGMTPCVKYCPIDEALQNFLEEHSRNIWKNMKTILFVGIIWQRMLQDEENLRSKGKKIPEKYPGEIPKW